MNQFMVRRWWAFVGVVSLAVVTAASHSRVSAQSTSSLVITEVHSAGNNNGTYAADWFEITNVGLIPVDITGWRVDDNSNLAANAVPLRGITRIPAGRSVVFVEGTADGSTDAALIAAFSTAWFGSATPPPRVLIGAYGGSGIGLSNGGDEVHLFDADEQPVIGVSFGANTAGVTFDNASGAADLSVLSADGTNGAFVSADGAEIGSPGRRSTPPTTIDLSQYVRIGRYDLPEPTRTTAPANSLLAQEVSAVTFNWDTGTLFVVGDAGTSVVQVTKTGELIDSMTLALGNSPQGSEFYDPEGLTYVGRGQFVMVEERDRQAVLFTYAAGQTLTREAAKTVKLGTFAPNIGLEGITFDPTTGGFIAVKEISPQGIFQTGIDFAAGTATNGSPSTENSVDLFDPALMGLDDLADVYALSNLPSLPSSEAEHLLVLSHESGRIVKVARDGTLAPGTLSFVADSGNPLSVADHQHEGLTMDDDGILYVVNENGGGDADHPQLWVFAPSTVPNEAPTAISLTNQRNVLPEHSSTASPLKVADVVVVDDGIGVNVLTVTGADAAAFTVDTSGLFIKAGTVLDFETKSVYTVTVEVDDPNVGISPDASVSFSLTLTDIVEEPPVPGSVAITEVAPWASGNSPYGTDWFELTNIGNTPVDLTGWRMDDSSASFASSVALTGVDVINPGESVIFLETSDLVTARSNFLATWFAGGLPQPLKVGAYSGSGVGLSTGGDAVIVFDGVGVVKASISFGASPVGPSFPSFDNTAALNDTLVSLLSTIGSNGAFAAAGDAAEIGSPGNIGPPAGRLAITEVAAWSSGNSPVGADWFEVTNVGPSAVDITGWKVDDSSESPVAAALLNGVTSIAPGESVIFLETADLAATKALFLSTWFGAQPPAGLQVGSYSGSGLGLSTGGDAVNLYDGGGVLRAKVYFGASPAGPVFATFDNAAAAHDQLLTLLSVSGVNGAFAASADANEVGSPGTIESVFVPASVIVSEVTPWSSGNAPYEADWFEITNIGTEPVDLAGWRVDDSSNVFASAVALRGVAVLPPGASAVFLEAEADGSTDAAVIASFAQAWFGTSVLPAGMLVGAYGGPGIGLSTGGDAIVLFDADGNRITGVAFGASTTGVTFDNAAGLGAVAAPFPTLTTLSSVGVNGAFVAVDGIETGSPGTIVQRGDTTPPVLDPLPTISTSTTANEAVVTFAPTATDDVSAPAAIVVTCAPASGSTFAAGTTPVSCTAQDEAGNVSEPVTFMVIVNRHPSAVLDEATTLEGQAAVIPVLANDGDADGDGLVLDGLSVPAHGIAAIDGTGVRYTPAPGFHGDDVFQYVVADGRGGMATGVVTVRVSRIGRFVALSRDHTWLQSGVKALTGDVGALEPRAAAHAADATTEDGADPVTVRVGVNVRMQQPASRVVGDTIRVLRNASIYDAISNTLTKDRTSTVRGTVVSPLPLPFVELPAFPAIQPGAQPIAVAKNKTLTLDPGAYGAVTVANGGRLILSGGLYELASLDVLVSATVQIRGAAEIRILGALKTASKAKLVIDRTVAGLTAADVAVYVQGSDAQATAAGADADGDNAGPVAVHIGPQNQLQASIYAPNGTVWVKSRTKATGAFIGMHVRVGKNAELTLDSAFR